MKSYPIFFLLLFSAQFSFSQIKFGLKVGVNLDSSGDIVLIADQLQKQGPLDGKTGFHLGVYTEVDFLILYLRPELQYTKVSSQFENNLILFFHHFHLIHLLKGHSQFHKTWQIL